MFQEPFDLLSEPRDLALQLRQLGAAGGPRPAGGPGTRPPPFWVRSQRLTPPVLALAGRASVIAGQGRSVLLQAG